MQVKLCALCLVHEASLCNESDTVANWECSSWKKRRPWGLPDLIKQASYNNQQLLAEMATSLQAGCCCYHRHGCFSHHSYDLSQSSLISPNSSHVECSSQSSFDTTRLLMSTTVIYNNTLTLSPPSHKPSLLPLS